jgi:hypothetical protein
MSERINLSEEFQRILVRNDLAINEQNKRLLDTVEEILKEKAEQLEQYKTIGQHELTKRQELEQQIKELKEITQEDAKTIKFLMQKLDNYTKEIWNQHMDLEQYKAVIDEIAKRKAK